MIFKASIVYLSVLLALGTLMAAEPPFLLEQRKAERFRMADSWKKATVELYFQNQGLKADQSDLIFVAYKIDAELEVWARPKHSSKPYKQVVTYPICAASGEVGPKRRQGDAQVPEGLYHIDRFNPFSNYHLSLGINYPNASDRARSQAPNLGGDIFIHGDCVTIGCLPMGNDKIREIYLMAVLAKAYGQSQIPVLIFPTHMTPANIKSLTSEYAHDSDRLQLWKELTVIYESWIKNKLLPKVTFGKNGEYVIGG